MSFQTPSPFTIVTIRLDIALTLGANVHLFSLLGVHPSLLSGIPTPKSEGNCLLLAWLRGSCCHLSPPLSRSCTSRPLLCILPKVASGVALPSLFCVQQGGVGEHDGHYTESKTEAQG